MGRTQDKSNAYKGNFNSRQCDIKLVELSPSPGESRVKGKGYYRSLSHDAAVNNSNIETSRYILHGNMQLID